MYRSPPQPLNNDFYLSGDVTIDPNVAIATGVILQADPDSQIVIATGVCIGMGAIIHAYQGKIEVEAGATIGAGVLVVGHGTIGAKACIGAEATLLNPAIAAKQVVPTGTIIGDESRSVTPFGDHSPAPVPTDPEAVSGPKPGPGPLNVGEPETLSSPSDEDHDSAQEDLSSTEQQENLQSGEDSEPSPERTSAPDSAAMTSSGESSNPPATIVYGGQVHLNHLLNTLLPHRKSLNNSNPPDRSPEKPVK